MRVPIEPPLPPDATPPPAISGARGSNRPLVVIDAGHGGHDPGAPGVDGKHREKEATLADRPRDPRRAESLGPRARRADARRRSLPVLGERREIARRLKADLFISIHADSAPNAGARGATIYTLSEVASDRVAAQLAARENRADILNGVNLGGETSEVSSILLDLAQRETMNVSASFAALLQREMSPKVPFRTEFHRFAGLVVLKAPDVPSVLLETGYMSNAGRREGAVLEASISRTSRSACAARWRPISRGGWRGSRRTRRSFLVILNLIQDPCATPERPGRPIVLKRLAWILNRVQDDAEGAPQAPLAKPPQNARARA